MDHEYYYVLPLMARERAGDARTRAARAALGACRPVRHRVSVRLGRALIQLGNWLVTEGPPRAHENKAG